MAAEKSIGDFYELFSKSFDLQQQMLHSLLRVESELKSQSNQRTQKHDPGIIQTTVSPVPLLSTNTTTASTPPQATTTQISPNNVVGNNRAYVVTEIVDVVATFARNSVAPTLNSKIVFIGDETKAEQSRQKDNSSMGLCNENDSSSSVQHKNPTTETNPPIVIQINQPWEHSTYLPSTHNIELQSTATSPQQIISGADTININLIPPSTVTNESPPYIPKSRAAKSSKTEDTAQLPRNNDSRDIPKTPPGTTSPGKIIHVNDILCGLVAYLLNESSVKKVDITGEIVRTRLSTLRDLAAGVTLVW